MSSQNFPDLYSFKKHIRLLKPSFDLASSRPTNPPPQFFRDQLTKRMTTDNQQYCRIFGSLDLTNAIIDVFQPLFSSSLDLSSVNISAGTTNAIFNIILGLCNPGEEIVVFEPFDENYSEQAKLANAIIRSVPLIEPPFTSSLEQESARWTIDFDVLQQSISSKTKLVLLNMVHWPTGTVWSKEELEKINELLSEFPNVRVVQDCSDITNMRDSELTLFANLNWEKSLTIFNGGKLICADGIKVGWTVGSAANLKPVFAFHQSNLFCLWEPLQNALADTIVSEKNGLLDFKKRQLNERVEENRKKIVQKLLEKNSNFYLSEAGNGILIDVCEDSMIFFERACEKGVIVWPLTFNVAAKISTFIRIDFGGEWENVEKALDLLSFEN